MANEYANKTDEELVLLMKDRHTAVSGNAFTELYERYSQRVFAYIRRVINDEEQTEDLFQETFYKFYQNVKSSVNNGTIIGYLITIARNLCLNYKRDKKTTLSIDDIKLLDYSSGSDYEEAELVDLVTMSMELLEMEYREPLVLRVYNGLNYNEIAEICKTSESNARSRVHRAKQKIKTILTPYLKDLAK